MNKVLIYLDQIYQKESTDLLEIVNRIYVDEEVKTYGVSLFQCDATIQSYFDIMINIQSEPGNQYQVRWIAACLEQLHLEYQFDCIILPATVQGRMLAPTLAARLETGLVADVTDINREGSNIWMIRPAFDGKIMAAIESQGSQLIMMSVRLGVFYYKYPKSKNPELIHKIVDAPSEGIKVRSIESKEAVTDIRDAKVLISGGGGVGQQFDRLDGLAKRLDGMVSASRSIVDKGIAPRRIQVGQSGKTVSPKLYMALGIYGSLQHVEGMKNIEHIISVNTNKDAPICSLAEIVVEGDALEFIERLMEHIKKHT